ncbi:EAL domain-containing protein [Variovorax guangxiensis]|nr:EAL domain-containing protein [Variovorax guangxiensis]RZI63756.1 MAG: EAL domain-containing protein [Variovorax sp.]
MLRKPLARTVMSMACGAVIAVVLALTIGEWTVRRQQNADAGEMAEAYIARSDAISTEAATALAEINETADNTCPMVEVARLRRIVLDSRYLKSAARVRNGEIYCSSTVGLIDPPVPLPPADVTSGGGRRLSFNAPQAGVPGARALLLQAGGAAVGLNGQAYLDAVDPRLEFTVVTSRQAPLRTFTSSGPRLPLDGVTLRPGEPVELDDRRFEVRCSDVHANCILAALRGSASIFQSPMMLEFGVFGLLIGLSGGFAASVFITRSKSLGKQLRMAMRSGQLKIVYQPIVRLSDRRQVGAEALLRWTDATGKPVSPDAFISAAEHEGFIGQITRFVVNRVLEELGPELRRRPAFQVTINVAASDILDNAFLPFLGARLQEAALSAGSIGLELTERTTANSRELGKAIARLREAGHKVYIDDFGTDYSSLSYLSRLRVDAIKINRTFMQALHDQSEEDTIAPQIVAMAEVLGLNIVIEGIEEEQQAAYFLTLAPKAMAQGWLFSKPVEAGRLFAG